MSSSLFGQPAAGGSLFGPKTTAPPSIFGSSAPAANGATSIAGTTAGGSGGSGSGFLGAPKKQTEGGSSLFSNAQTSAPSTILGQKPPADNAASSTGKFGANNKPATTSSFGGADSTKGSEKPGSMFGGSTVAGTSTTSTIFGGAGGTGFGGAPSNDASKINLFGGPKNDKPSTDSTATPDLSKPDPSKPDLSKPNFGKPDFGKPDSSKGGLFG